MKDETYLKKLNKILGISPEVAEQAAIQRKIQQGDTVGIPDEEIEKFRELEGVIYFLQAPELFHSRVCAWCDASFFVSRLNVAHCSYSCLEAHIWEDYGVKWRRRENMELMVKEVYGGNEPLWVRNLPRLQKALLKLTEALGTSPKESESSPSVPTSSPTVKSSSLKQSIPIPKISS
jgi:hypothetical protein